MEKNVKTWFAFLISLVLLILWGLSLVLSYETFQNKRYDDALAEVNSIFPLFYIVIFLFSVLCISVVWYDLKSRALYLALCLELGIMLWLTPYLLSGFCRFSDGLWHLGVSEKIGIIVQGGNVPNSWYGRLYPLSFVFNFEFLNSSGIEKVDYARFLFPLFACIAIILLWYVFVSRVSNNKTAYLATLLGITGMHYVEVHVSPHALGTILLFTGFILTSELADIEKGRLKSRSIVLFFLGLLSLVLYFTHIISFLILIMFIPTFILVNCVVVIKGRDGLGKKFGMWITGGGEGGRKEKRPGKRAKIPPHISLLLVTFLLVALLLLFLRYKSPELFYEFIIGSGRFHFGWIYMFNKGIYLLYCALSLMGLYVLIGRYEEGNIPSTFRNVLLSAKRSTILAIIFQCVLFLFTICFIATTGEYIFIERGLSLFILFASFFFVSLALNESLGEKPLASWLRNNRKKVIAAFLIFLALTFPLISYSIDAYSSHPDSERKGLEFVGSRIYLEGKTISIGSYGQLVAFVGQETHYTDTGFPFNSSKTSPHFVVFRRSSFFRTAVRGYETFEENSVTKLHDEIDQKGNYDKIYSSHTFEIYSKLG